VVNERSGLLTLAAYITVTMLIVLVALLGIFRYGAVQRVSSLAPLPDESTTELAQTGLQLSAGSPQRAGGSSTLEKRRSELLESLLAERTKLVQQQSAQIDRQSMKLAELERRYDSAMLAVEMLQGDSAAEPAEQGERDAAQQAQDPTAAKEDPARLEAELMLARAVHDTLVHDLDLLQGELEIAHQQIERMKEESAVASTNQLRDALILEAASAGVLLRVGREAVPALIDTLGHANPVVRRWAATVLGGMGADAENAVNALSEALSDSDAGVRNAAKAALDALER